MELLIIIVLATAKIHILKQFTTGTTLIAAEQLIVLATAKIHILKQFTTRPDRSNAIIQLCLLLQRYTFWSNSQRFHRKSSEACIVLATAKIHILKQFTTLNYSYYIFKLLCLLLQRYTFWSNSQRRGIKIATPKIVLATAKIHILKQFTTKNRSVLLPVILCLLLQRYTFWSNSQHVSRRKFRTWHCACYCKDTHFEAIHNLTTIASAETEIVLATAKIHILKQFTTKTVLYLLVR